MWTPSMPSSPPKDVEFTRELDNTPWHTREFVLKDGDGRLLAFGANLD
jgi:hypothetical protein